MVAQIIDGKKIANKLLEEVKQEIEKRTNLGERHPCLAVILVGNNPASHVYVKNKKLACEKVGIKSISYDFDTSITEKYLLTLIKEINSNQEIDGVLIQSPLPEHIDDNKIINAINP